jgi:inhibitor of cysteine peptidase
VEATGFPAYPGGMTPVLVAEDCELEGAVGELVTLRLPENATTGYQWTVAEVGSGLQQEDERTVVDPAAVPGAAGAHEFDVRPLEPGRWNVLLRLGRSWEGAATQERRVVLTVR